MCVQSLDLYQHPMNLVNQGCYLPQVGEEDQVDADQQAVEEVEGLRAHQEVVVEVHVL